MGDVGTNFFALTIDVRAADLLYTEAASVIWQPDYVFSTQHPGLGRDKFGGIKHLN